MVKLICSILDRLHPRKKGQYADLVTFVADGLDTMRAMQLIPAEFVMSWVGNLLLALSKTSKKLFSGIWITKTGGNHY